MIYFVFLLKLLVVALFFVMFLRGSRVVWGIGLLTVSTAFLLDTTLGTFDRQTMEAEFGFFYHVLSGALFAGAALWLWGLLSPQLSRRGQDTSTESAMRAPAGVLPDHSLQTSSGPVVEGDAAVDPHMLFREIHQRLAPEEVRDLIFDVQLNENDVLAPQQEMTETIRRLLDCAESAGKLGALALAVERILTPVSPKSLPRREKLAAHSPPTVLRHFLLANYSLGELADLAAELDLDWEQLGHGDKREKVRSLLLHLQRRNRLDDLIRLLQSREPSVK